MNVFCYVLGIIITLYHGKGEDFFDCTNSVDGKSETQTYCKKMLDHRDAERETTVGQQSVPTEFVCQLEGRFPDVSDSTCMRYFQCERMNNGTFNKKSLKCPNSTFCGSTQKCSSVYVCPCGGATSSEMQTSSYSHGTTVKTTAHPCSVSFVADFNCSSVGRFPDISDITCQEYFLCSHLYNGSYIKTKYKCQNSFFDPVIKRCTVSFICPCTTTSNTSTVTVTTTTSQYLTNGIASSSAVTSSTRSPSTIHITSDNVPISSTMSSNALSTQHGCTMLSKEFECINEGRFPDFSDVTCRKYFLCSTLRNGTFIKTSYGCKYSSFNPLTLRCSTDYLCPCTADQTTAEITTMSSDFSTLGSFTTPSAITLTTKIEKPSTAIPSLSTHEENKTIVTNTLLSSTVTSSVPSGTAECADSSQEFECAIEGRFADLTDFTCKKYFLCSQLRNGTIIKTKYRCPTASTFYPLIQHCSSEYICPCSTTTPTTTVFLTSSTKPSTVELTPTIVSKTTTYSTPFSVTPIENATILTSSLPSSSETTSSYSNSTVGCTTSYNEFQCTIAGRFPDLSDTTCRKYFLCSKLRNETFIKTPYTCLNSTFNPLLFQCSGSYVCPCNAEYTSVTTQMHSTSTSEGFTTAPAVTSTTSYTCNTISGDIPEFNCSAIGRFPDYSDITCRKYFLCSQLRNGTFVKTSYSCPVSSCINSSIQRCSSSCKCPCLL